MKVMESIKNQKLPTCIVNRLEPLKEKGIKGMLEGVSFLMGYEWLLERPELCPWISTLNDCEEMIDEQWEFVKSFENLQKNMAFKSSGIIGKNALIPEYKVEI